MPTVADVKLWLYNKALEHLGSRPLTSLTANAESRRALDAAWDGNVRDFALEKGQWKFAKRIAKITYNPSANPTFGYRYAFTKPSDLKRLISLCEDEYFREPLLRYQDQGSYWLSDLDTIYVEYVSNDAAYGYDLSRWTDSFKEYVGIVLAQRVAKRLKGESSAGELMALAKNALADALALDAQADPTRFPPRGRWASARMGNVDRKSVV